MLNTAAAACCLLPHRAGRPTSSSSRLTGGGAWLRVRRASRRSRARRRLTGLLLMALMVAVMRTLAMISPAGPWSRWVRLGLGLVMVVVMVPDMNVLGPGSAVAWMTISTHGWDGAPLFVAMGMFVAMGKRRLSLLTCPMLSRAGVSV